MTSLPPVPPPPGWYYDGAVHRWWDGTAWGMPAPPSRPETDEERGKTLAIFANLGSIAGWFFLPLALRLACKDNPFVKHHATEGLNLQILFLILWNGSLGPAIFIGPDHTVFFVCVVVALSAGAANVVLSVIGAIRASRGEWHRYPVNLRLVRGAVVVPKDARGRRLVLR